MGKEEQGSKARNARQGVLNDADFATTQGHAENPYNNRCDQLAVAESQKYK